MTSFKDMIRDAAIEELEKKELSELLNSLKKILSAIQYKEIEKDSLKMKTKEAISFLKSFINKPKVKQDLSFQDTTTFLRIRGR